MPSLVVILVKEEFVISTLEVTQIQPINSLIKYDWEYKLILNNSVNPDKDYFSLYDIKNILGIDIEYIISKDFHIKNMDSLTLDGDIISIKNSNFKDYKVFKTIASDIVGGNYE